MDCSNRNKKLLTRAAVQGIVSGLALLACGTNERLTNVNAPMESTSSSTSNASKPSPTTAGKPLLPITAHDEPQDRDCCNGKNDCKGLSGCANENASHDCKGKNECKGKGTSCDFSDEGQPPRPNGSKARGNCCNGKNDCKGKSGCRTAKNPSGPGLNQCKAQGTACDPPTRRRP